MIEFELCHLLKLVRLDVIGNYLVHGVDSDRLSDLLCPADLFINDYFVMLLFDDSDHLVMTMDRRHAVSCLPPGAKPIRDPRKCALIGIVYHGKGLTRVLIAA